MPIFHWRDSDGHLTLVERSGVDTEIQTGKICPFQPMGCKREKCEFWAKPPGHYTVDDSGEWVVDTDIHGCAVRILAEKIAAGED